MHTTEHTVQVNDWQVPYRILAPNDHKEWAVLWLQGFTSSMDSHLEGVTRMVEATGVTFATLDYSGHGKHSQPLETATRQQQFNEVVAVYDQLKTAGYKNIIVVGGSFGGYMAALLSAERELAALVMRVPAIYKDEEFELPYNKTARWDSIDDHRAWRQSITADDTLDAFIAVKNFSGPTYVIEHADDEIVPRNVPKAYFSVAKEGNYLVVPNTGHSPKTGNNPGPRYAYIEHLVISIVKAVQLRP